MEQLGVAYRFGEAGVQHITGRRALGQLIGDGAQQNTPRSTQHRVRVHVLRERHAVHPGHVHVDDGDVEWVTIVSRGA